jgi:hypothetical protein
MATTTNYGWTTPDDTDLVKDGAAAIRTLGSSVDTTTKALNPETTTGDIAYRSATANTNTRLALGTAGQVLTVNTGATAPEWATPAAGKILQVVQGTLTGNVSTTSGTFADTGLSVSITPSAATSKVLILVSHNTRGLGSGSSAESAAVYIDLLRGATSLAIPGNAPATYFNAGGGTGTRDLSTISGFHYLDSPATTSATTYKTQYRAVAGTGYVNVTNMTSTIIAMEVGA